MPQTSLPKIAPQRPLKIAIEAQRIFRHNKHGMDFVAIELIRALQKLDTVNHYRVYVAPGGDRVLGETTNFEIITLPSKFYPHWEQWQLARAVRKWGADVLHCTSNTAPLRLRARLVLTLHDVIFMKPSDGKSPSLYQRMGRVYRRWVVPKVISRMTKGAFSGTSEGVHRIITVSNYEKNEILSTFSLDRDMVEVIYNSPAAHFRPRKLSQSIQQKYHLPPRFILTLGNTDPKKNTARTLEAYAFYRSLVRDPLPLVVVDVSAEVMQKMLPEGFWAEIKDYVWAVGYVSNCDLPQLYSAASLFLYLSLQESFGLPPLEAMACEVAVIASSATALPEVLGDAALLVDPLDTEAIARAMIEIEFGEYVARGKERVGRFSWERSAERLLRVYEGRE